MKKLCFFSLVIFLIFSCEKDITVYIEKGPGTIVGQILPTGIDAFVEIRKSGETVKIYADTEGYFKIEDLEPGHYNLTLDAPAYGKKTISNLYIGDAEIFDIGVIQLLTVPYPIDRISVSTGGRSYSNNYTLTIYFTEEMDWESVIGAFQIDPAVNDFTYNYYSSSYSYIYFYFYLNMGSSYSITLDTTAVTASGEPLEFPYTYQFTTQPFCLTSVEKRIYDGSIESIRLTFNSQIDYKSIIQNLTINPSIGVTADGYYPSTGVYLYPINGWISDTLIIFTISHSFSDINGNTLAADTTFTIQTNPLNINSFTPYNNQCYVSVDPYIRITLNNIIDESTIDKALHVSPEFTYNINTHVSYGYSYFYIYPDSSLQTATTYTIEIDTSLTDFYGVHLPEKYVSTFTTK